MDAGAQYRKGVTRLKVALVKTPAGFRPDSKHDAEQLEDIPIGDVIYGNFKRPRNPRFHRYAFGILHDIFENQDMFEDWEPFYRYMKIASGAVDETINAEGKVFYTLKSLSFADMGEDEFRKVVEGFKTAAYEHLKLGEWVLGL